MAPNYHIENAYSIYPIVRPVAIATDYEVNNPETRFERNVYYLYAKAKRHLYHEEYALALNSFKEIQALILKTVDPKLPPTSKTIPGVLYPISTALLEPLYQKTANILKSTPPAQYSLPAGIFKADVSLDNTARRQLNLLGRGGMQVISYHREVGQLVDQALGEVQKENWRGAINLLAEAQRKVPPADKKLGASLTHDMAVLHEKNNSRNKAVELINQSIRQFSAAKAYNGQVMALQTLSGFQLRNNKLDDAKATINTANGIIQKQNLHTVNIQPVKTVSKAGLILSPVVSTDLRAGTGSGLVAGNVSTVVSSNLLSTALANAALSDRPAVITRPGTFVIGGRSVTNGNGNRDRSARAANGADLSLKFDTSLLLAKQYLANNEKAIKKEVRIVGEKGDLALAVENGSKVKSFLNQVSVSEDLGILTAYLVNPVQMVAYLPHMYFFVLPMAVGDCYQGLGRLSKAEESFLSTLKYPYINKKAEIVQLWLRLANLYLEKGDKAYRAARDKTAAYGGAKKFYERIVRSNGTINPNAPLYKDPKFTGIRARITSFLQPHAGAAFFEAFGGTDIDENPALLAPLLEAKVKLYQIQKKLNFFGFATDYIPPFSFEYMQNTARYFAQQAGQIEQKYMQYKATAENEELRYDQLEQQVELAQQTVVLEERNKQEAQRGEDVAEANLNYAETRRQHAVQERSDFNNVRWELLELAEAEAWAGAAAMDEDDEVKQTWNGHYYNSNRRRRSRVLQDLAYKKTRISHDLQAKKLDRAVAAANDYKKVAEAQLDQARARVRVAEQRKYIAEIQLKHARENREFLQLKEFGASMWYQLARHTKKLARHYLDMATEISMLMERAYNAETERGLQVIRFDYVTGQPGGLLGANELQRDIDYFTHDMLTNIRSRKAPMKKTISLADDHPVAFNALINAGHCQFITELTDFDRQHPGMYLCKIKNVELLFVGITRATSIAGSLRNIGVSRFRDQTGNLHARLYPADVMPLSQYDLRQDALAFRFDPKDLKLFENHGLETLWELRLRRDGNDFDFRQILDIQLIIYYDGFFSTTLEQKISNALPKTGQASRAVSLRLFFPDELFYLKNKGEAILEFTLDMFPFNHTKMKRSSCFMKVTGQPGTVRNLTIECRSKVANKTLKLTTDNKGEVAPGSFTDLKNKKMLDTWTIHIKAADNPALVTDGEIDLSGMQDLSFVMEYNFTYRQ